MATQDVKKPARRSRQWLAPALLCLFSTAVVSAENGGTAGAQSVQLYLHARKALAVAEATGVLVLDENVCRAQLSAGQVQLYGTGRGSTVVFVWAGERRATLRVEVEERPSEAPAPRLARNGLDAAGRGALSSSAQSAISPRGDRTYFLLHQFEWTEQHGDGRLTLRGQAQNSTVPGVPLFNANSASVSYESPRTRVSLLDFPLEMNGGIRSKISNYSIYNVYTIRGAEVTLRRGANEFQVFGGVTIPPYYLRLSGTRDVAGLNFTRTVQPRLTLYSTTAWVSSPMDITGGSTLRRQSSVFQTAGLSWRATEQLAFQATAGGSTRGTLAQGTLSYLGPRASAFLTGTSSSPDFPLNQLQLLSSGGSSLTAGGTLRMNSHVVGSVYAQRSETTSRAAFQIPGAADYVNPNLALSLSPRHSVSLNYSFSRYWQRTQSAGRSRTSRLDTSLNSQFGHGVSNTAQFTSGRLYDPAGVNSEDQLMLRNSLNLPVPGGSFSLTVQHSFRNPSLIKRLNEQIALLSPELQVLFQMNPAAFTQSANLPASVRAVLESLEPSDSVITAGGQFRIGRRLNFSPSASYIRDAPGLSRNSRSHTLGYSLSYQVTSTLQITSSLGSTLLYDPWKNALQRTTVVTLGINKTLSGDMRTTAPFTRPRSVIRGRVYRDMNLNGTFNMGEPGIAGARVQLNTGESAVTDSEGRFVFARLRPGSYLVRLPLAQFGDTVRVTTPAEVAAELTESAETVVSFGTVNFARVIGTVFNDHLLDGARHPDAVTLPHIRLSLTGNGVTRQILTDGAGNYALYDITPGEYELSVDRTSLPANYTGQGEAMRLLVRPVSTVTTDIPIRALRSISGHVYVRTADPKAPLRPVAGVRLRIADVEAVTDAEGRFILRQLPAGELTLAVIPALPLPAGMTAPSGKVRLPKEPVQAEGASIVISNPALLDYLTSDTRAAGRPRP